MEEPNKSTDERRNGLIRFNPLCFIQLGAGEQRTMPFFPARLAPCFVSVGIFSPLVPLEQTLVSREREESTRTFHGQYLSKTALCWMPTPVPLWFNGKIPLRMRNNVRRHRCLGGGGIKFYRASLDRPNVPKRGLLANDKKGLSQQRRGQMTLWAGNVLDLMLESG